MSGTDLGANTKVETLRRCAFLGKIRFRGERRCSSSMVRLAALCDPCCRCDAWSLEHVPMQVSDGRHVSEGARPMSGREWGHGAALSA